MRRVDLARSLLEHGLDAIAQDREGATLLHLAVRMGRVDLVCLLVKHGADVTTQDQYGLTPLYLALQERYVSLECFLIEHGARYEHGRLRRIGHRFRTMWQSIRF